MLARRRLPAVAPFGFFRYLHLSALVCISDGSGWGEFSSCFIETIRGRLQILAGHLPNGYSQFIIQPGERARTCARVKFGSPGPHSIHIFSFIWTLMRLLFSLQRKETSFMTAASRGLLSQRGFEAILNRRVTVDDVSLPDRLPHHHHHHHL